MFDLRRGELIDKSMPIVNQQCACEPCGCVVSPQKTVEKEGKYIAPSHVLMAMPLMTNVAVFVIAVD